ncbi:MULTISPECIES: exopolysaccharide Pel transporter PelG [unclassified Paludibacterium]|uniref:exopolysaccharide Pel transporter PelG n=1 Tax=unclassified Paludibacterium TaxID=2618429 RepID=UPI001C05B90A|nr:exopolysaccharide Pel transporter PelG [Paludibacterium sp. B53371]BEV71941.1 exopolysaccharide Pel transporter PelG [Paludibacterium sp. THUN1379]
MAGIGFELRKMLRRNSLAGLLQAYTYAGLISAGPWMLSIVGILLIGVLSLPFVVPTFLIAQFQVSVTYLIAGSLVLTGPFQLAYTRFTADRLFEKRQDLVLSNFHGVVLLINLGALLFGVPTILWLFHGTSGVYRLFMLSGFVILANIWIAAIFLSGQKRYMHILLVFLIGYGATVVGSLLLNTHGLEGLLAGFVLGQCVLLFGLLLLIYREFPGRLFISFEMFHKAHRHTALMWIGLLYNLGIWVDKLMFWYAPATGQAVIGPLHASIIYDMPVFLAYLAIIPGMAVFLMRIETDFVEYYDAFYSAVREGASLQHIENVRNGMVDALRTGLYEIVKVQSIAAILLFASGAELLRWLGISVLYLPLLQVDVIAASLQVVFLGIINIFFYLDKRRVVLAATSGFLLLNMLLTGITLQLNPAWYGYGFAGAMLIAVVIGLAALDRKLERLEYETYMLQ